MSLSLQILSDRGNDWPRFALEVVKLLVSWPVIVLALAITFKKPIGGWIDRLRAFEGLGVRAELETGAVHLAEAVAAINDLSPPQPTEEPSKTVAKDRVGRPNRARSQLAQGPTTISFRMRDLPLGESKSARRSMIEAWGLIEARIEQATRKHLDPNGVAFPASIFMLGQHGILSSETVSMIEAAYSVVRPLLSGESDLTPSLAALSAFKSSAHAIVRRVGIEARLGIIDS